MSNDKQPRSEEDLEKIALQSAYDDYYSKKNKGETVPKPSEDNFKSVIPNMPSKDFDVNTFQETVSKETDPDLMIGFDIIKLPSKGIYYKNKISEVKVEYLTSQDEDLLTTPALIENGTVFDVLLRRKIKTQGITIDEMMSGDKTAILLFLRASSYGHEYTVRVNNPYTGKPITQIIDLTKFKYKEITDVPDEKGEFSVKIPMRNKLVKFRMLNDTEINIIIEKAEQIKEAYGNVYSELSTLRLKSCIMEIDGNRDKSYIHRFVDAMPAGDALAIRKKISKVSPDVDMNYTFTTPEGTFSAPIVMDIDFFFPSH